MLREVPDAAFVPDGGLLRRYDVRLGRRVVRCGLRPRRLRAILADAAHGPVLLLRDEGARKQHWLLGDRFWSDDEDLSSADVLALVHQRDARRDRRLRSAHADLALAAGDARAPAGARREAIPAAVREVVFVRDGGACVACGARFDLQYDHVIPLARGGASTVANLQVLCAPCNRAKGASL